MEKFLTYSLFGLILLLPNLAAAKLMGDFGAALISYFLFLVLISFFIWLGALLVLRRFFKSSLKFFNRPLLNKKITWVIVAFVIILPIIFYVLANSEGWTYEKGPKIIALFAHPLDFYAYLKTFSGGSGQFMFFIIFAYYISLIMLPLIAIFNALKKRMKYIGDSDNSFSSDRPRSANLFLTPTIKAGLALSFILTLIVFGPLIFAVIGNNIIWAAGDCHNLWFWGTEGYDSEYECQLQSALKNNDVSLCARTASYKQDQCYIDVAKLSNDISHCDKIPEYIPGDPYYSPHRRKPLLYEICYSIFTGDDRDKTICQRIEREDSRFRCLLNIALDERDIAFCESSKNINELVFCYQRFTDYNWNGILPCEKIPESDESRREFKKQCYKNNNRYYGRDEDFSY